MHTYNKRRIARRWGIGLVVYMYERAGVGLATGVLLSICLASTAVAQTGNPALLLFGGQDHKTFLGCLNCAAQSQESICNDYGTFGGKYNADSIWNKYGTYGSQYNSDSPWNKYSSPNVVVVDQEGGFYGYFTINKYSGKRTTLPALVAFLDKAAEMEDLDDVRVIFCGT